MDHPPVFTQKHYEFLIRELRREGADEKFIGVLIRIFRRDNPKFKPSLFRDNINREG